MSQKSMNVVLIVRHHILFVRHLFILCVIYGYDSNGRANKRDRRKDKDAA